jgi:hypothetical protein
MSQDAERIRGLIAFKKRLETRAEELESELQELRNTLETVNSMLLEKGFRHPEIKESAPTEVSLPKQEVAGAEPELTPEPQTRSESVTPLKTATGEILANLYVSKDSLRVVLAEDKDFDINTPPFTHFLVERVLLKMQERDSELVRTGQHAPDKIFCYNIIREGNSIRELVIKNFDSDRLRELKSSIRWTLEKMYEKAKSQS